MRKNYFLKQGAFALALLLTTTLIFYSCKKDSHNDPDISGADLRAARSWVKLNLKATENNPFKTLSPNWDDIYTTTEDNQAIIEVGLTNPDKIFVGDSPNDYSHPELGLARSHIRLVLFKDLGNNSIVAGCYMVVVNNAVAASAKLHYKSTGDLSGKIYYFNADGSFSNGALYSNGEIVKANGKINSLNQSLLNKKLYSTDIKKLNIGIKDKIIAVKSPCADGVDIPIWGQSCVGVEGYMTCTPYISGFAHLPGSCDGDYGDNGGYAGSHGGYAGNGSNSNPPLIEVKQDSLQKYYPCMVKEVLNKLAGNQVFGKLVQPFQKIQLPNGTTLGMQGLPNLKYDFSAQEYGVGTNNYSLGTTGDYAGTSSTIRFILLLWQTLHSCYCKQQPSMKLVMRTLITMSKLVNMDFLLIQQDIRHGRST